MFRMRYKMQDGGMPPEQGGNPEEEIAMQIMQAFQQLSPEMQQQLLQALAQSIQQAQARRGGYYRRGGFVNPYR